jgi:hypothetical protein
MKHWTEEQLRKLLADGKIRGYKINNPAKDPEKPKRKRAKFNNNKVEYDGHVFDSNKEYMRYHELLLLQKAGEIGQLRLQVPYELNEGGTHSYKYIADFVYIDRIKGKVVEDTKGFLTKEYKKKRRLMKKLFNIKIKET